MIFPKKYIMFAAILVVCSIANGQSGPCGETSCEQDRGWVTEALQGAEDGWNVTYALKSLPLNPSDVEIFRNGIPLEEEDVKVVGRTITFSPAQTPRAGDLVVARYRPSNSTYAYTHESQSPNNRQYQDEITLQAGRLALKYEERDLQRGTRIVRGNRDIGVAGSRINQSSGAGQSSSAVKMLLRRISKIDESRHEDYMASQSDTQGVDGLGDGIHGIYRVNRSIDSTLQDKPSEESTVASVRMLERLASQRDANSPKVESSLARGSSVVKSKSHSKAKALWQDAWR